MTESKHCGTLYKQTTTSSASFHLYGVLCLFLIKPFLGCKTCELEKLLGII